MRQRAGWIGIGALLLVIAEVAVFVLVAKAIGAVWAVLLIIAGCGLGGWLLRWEGVRAWRALRSAAGSAQPVGVGATSGVVGLLAALFLVVPGFLTDLAGLALLVPPVRRLAGARVQRFAEGRLSSATAGDLFGPRRVRVRRGAPGGATGEDTEVIEGEIIDPR
ncbi:MAG TPA: FxsA family protein [Rugosimonospora sp.]|nr:FxsA family protein [Rugosimonospora sp.]